MNDSEVLRYVDPASLDLSEGSFSSDERHVLQMVNQKVAAAESLDGIMNFLFRATQGLTACDRIGLAFLEEEGQRIVSRWVGADYEPVFLNTGYAEDLRGSSLSIVLEKGAPRIIRDLSEYLEAHPRSTSTALLVREGVRSSLTCPLRVEDRLVGVMFRSSRRPGAYSEREVRLHMAVAERLSQAVEKAYRIDQLEAVNQAYLEMLGFVSHELKSPLATIVMDAQVLIAGYLGALDPPQRERIERMVFRAEALLALIGDYLDLARIEGRELEPVFQEVDFIPQIVQPSLEAVKAQAEAKSMTIVPRVPEDPFYVKCDPALMGIVMANLLDNAVKYGDEQGEIRLVVDYTQSIVRVSVWNTGPGFPREMRSRLFRKFSRLPVPELLKRKGSGVGLYTAWRIIQEHKGKLRANSEQGKWAEFAFEIPGLSSGTP
jgi:signal transduction histidine kinase